MKEFWSDRARSLTPYVPGEQPKTGHVIKLNTNENPYPPSPAALKAMAEAANEDLRRYPDPEGTVLRRALGQFYSLDIDHIFVGNGSDEVLAMAFQAFFSQGSEIVFPDITYSFYPVYADLFGIRCRRVPLNADFTVPVAQLCGNNDGVVLANPNAPTGMGVNLDDLETLLRGNPDVAVIIDEAYVDFGGESALPLLEDYPNLLMVQTASKSRALAGARVGWAFGSPNLISALNSVKNSFNSYTLDRVALAGAAAAVEDEDYFRARCDQVARTRDETARALEQLGFTVCPSQTNFLFLSHPAVSAGELFVGLREQGILVRYFNAPRIDNYLRVTIGTPEEMEAFLQAVKELVPAP